MALNFKPENTKVLLVGTTQYYSPDFAPITPALGNIYELRRIFLNKDIVGLPNRNVHILINANISELVESLKRFKSDPNLDTFIFYYVGHGHIMWSEGKYQWFITAKDSVADVNDYSYVKRHSLQYDEFKKYVESIGEKRIVIFDACYSGQATQSANIISSDIQGTFTISSASANEQSLFDPSDDYTYFTKEFISVFKEGVKRATEFLSINDIYEELYQRIKKIPNLPNPTQKNNFSERFNLSKNIYFNKEVYKEQVKESTQKKFSIPETVIKVDRGRRIEPSKKSVILDKTKDIETDNGKVNPDNFPISETVPESKEIQDNKKVLWSSFPSDWQTLLKKKMGINKEPNRSELEKLFKLEKIICSNTGITDISPLKHFHDLKIFACSFTKVDDLSPLYDLKKLEYLNCRESRVTYAEAQKFKMHNVKCTVQWN